MGRGSQALISGQVNLKHQIDIQIEMSNGQWILLSGIRERSLV